MTFSTRYSRTFSSFSTLSNLRLRILHTKIVLFIITTGLFLSCDSVQWGGIEITLEGPPESLTQSPIIKPQVAQKTTPLDGRTFLYLGSTIGEEASLIPIVEILPSGFLSTPTTSYQERIKEFSASYFELGSQFTLFSDGSRVGTFITTHTDINQDYCHPRPEGRGIIRLAPGAEEVQSFLALARDFTTTSNFTDYRPVVQTRALRQASIDMVIDVIPSLGASWPPSVLESRKALNFFRPQPDHKPTIIATFTRNGPLEVGPSLAGMYSILLIGANREEIGYQATYVDYRPASTAGKAAGRYLNHLDLNGDGQSEVVLEMLGEKSKWISILGLNEQTWNKTYSDSCEPPDASNTQIF
jgi:hypothetical protein